MTGATAAPSNSMIATPPITAEVAPPPPVSSALDLIGNTPLVQVRSFDTGPCKLYLKLESQNPGGSIKDRIGRSMIEAAERDGKIGPGSTLIEATAGNTGLGLALVASSKGYKLVLVIPDKMSQEKLQHLRALGAQVVITRSDVQRGHPQYYQDVAERLSRETPNSFYINQFNNPANPLAHEQTTGPEIWQQTDGKLDAVVCGVGSGGTLTGLSNYFARVAPNVEMVLADPAGSILADYVKTGKIGHAGSWLVEGIGEDFIPSIADLSRVRKAYTVTDAQSVEAVRMLLKNESILAGSSTGTLLTAALRYCREQTAPKTVVTFVCDTGSKYLSKIFNDLWMEEQGFSAQESTGDLRDLIPRRFTDNKVISVTPDDTLTTALARMRLSDVSQLPVLDGPRLAGIVDESDLLLAVFRDRSSFDGPVRQVMTANVQTLPRNAGVDALLPIFDAGRVAVISDDQGFHGLITKVDALNYLRKQYQLMNRK
jgi:cystathionine beta-synthase